MSTVTKAANAHTVVSTGWTTPENAYSTTNDSTYATIATVKNQTLSGDFGFPAFTTAEIPAHSTLTSVVFYTTYGVTAAVGSATVGEQARRNSTGATLGSEITRSTASMADANGTATGATLTDLRTANELRIRARATKGNSSTASTAQIDRLYLVATFTEDVSASAGGIANSATLAATGTKATSKALGALSLSAGPGELGMKATGGTGTLALTTALALTGSAASGEQHSGVSSMSLTATLGMAGTKATTAAAGAISLVEGFALSHNGHKSVSQALGPISPTVSEAAAGRKAGTVSLSLVLSTGGTVEHTKQTSGALGALWLTATLALTGSNPEAPVVAVTTAGPRLPRRQVVVTIPRHVGAQLGAIALRPVLRATGVPSRQILIDDELLLLLEAI